MDVVLTTVSFSTLFGGVATMKIVELELLVMASAGAFSSGTSDAVVTREYPGETDIWGDSLFSSGLALGVISMLLNSGVALSMASAFSSQLFSFLRFGVCRILLLIEGIWARQKRAQPSQLPSPSCASELVLGTPSVPSPLGRMSVLMLCNRSCFSSSSAS